MFTETEVLLAADRFVITKTATGVCLRLADAFMPSDHNLFARHACVGLVRRALEKGHKVIIEVSHGPDPVSSAASATLLSTTH
jgi:hypothetical protein